jgi:2-keto-4-pentenoate hydratase/2-oxohepta-3-ene-1,7-dioic acid hydratase in catechol pathway
MKIVRYEDAAGVIRHGVLHPDDRVTELAGELFGARRDTKVTSEVRRLLAPLEPAQIFGVGLNYRRHAEESGAKVPEQPVLFMKSANTLQHPGEPIVLPAHLRSDEVDYEVELAVVIGRACRNVPRAHAFDYVLGYTVANDVSARDWQLKRGGGQWTRGKCFDTFCPLGPCLVTTDEIPDPNALALRTVLNGEVVQDWNTRDMIFSVAELIAFLSGSTTLAPGTVILTGTPHGVGMAAKPPRWLREGDVVAVEVEKIGRLENPVVRETPASAGA